MPRAWLGAARLPTMRGGGGGALTRLGACGRLVASASRGAGSEDAGDSLPLRAGMQLRERRMAEFSVDEVCEQLAVSRASLLLGIGTRRFEAPLSSRWTRSASSSR